jgi:hypothetical protein
VSKAVTAALGKIGAPAVSQIIERLGAKTKRREDFFGLPSAPAVYSPKRETPTPAPSNLPEEPVRSSQTPQASVPAVRQETAMDAINNRLVDLDEKTLKYVTSLIPPGVEWTRDDLIKRLIESTEEQKKEIKQRADLLIERANTRLQMIMERLL